ncbi:Piso0_005295 [Millerozyma farinosa CBS 7064]|uniref:Piso0_005295 protein n=1 Tax=Pichia sorbitophila (strain ATCC MYA-4447 / BCRC 22081 / CBS 7064 / NBRC 10061 / NRRL Y-12695) TaxID=559304 RepID=G8Y1S9_PICSO|nr:Piso0_005295 [Millerozyma farinosa CBS 7064]
MFSFAKKIVDRFEGGINTNDVNSDSYFKDCLTINNKGYGLRIVRVNPHSTAHEKGLESWFDYIVRVNNHELPMMYPSLSGFNYSINDDGTINYGGQTTQDQAGMINVEALKQELIRISQNTMGSKELVLDVWSAKGGIVRKVVIPLKAPNSDKSGADENEIQSLHVDAFEQIGFVAEPQHLNTATHVWRILNTHPESPAFRAQLVPYSDYIIGCDSTFDNEEESKGLLHKGGESLLSKTVMAYYNKHYASTGQDFIPITLYVYNHDYDILRPVTINLSRSWCSGHNKGILGCDVGYGLLHRIPEIVGKFGEDQIVDDVLFDPNPDTNANKSPVGQAPERSAPSTISQPPPISGFVPSEITSPPKRHTNRKKKSAGAKATLDDLNDYVNEELENSSKKESNYSSETGKTVSPPPKSK